MPAVLHEYTYREFHRLNEEMAAKGTTSGKEQSPERIEATKLNLVRMNRLDKTVELIPELKEVIAGVKRKLQWVILAEIWCGDGAQNIPVIAKMAALNPNIDLKLVFRDENPELMDTHLSNGARAVPKLICYDAVTGKEIGNWGPRPAAIQQMVKDYKAANPTVSHDEFVKNLHLWYARDKAQALQKEFIDLVRSWA